MQEEEVRTTRMHLWKARALGTLSYNYCQYACVLREYFQKYKV